MIPAITETAADLLVDLVRTPSVSGDEELLAQDLASWAAGSGLDVFLDDKAVRVTVDFGLAGPTLLFASHLDTVPPGDGWTVNPFEGVVRGRRLIGRGAVDAKAS
ncbi:MAG: M20 family metallo-hydrolase, partial [bacterium]|nr:M20 family metallo-hydrolase [bacterium]